MSRGHRSIQRLTMILAWSLSTVIAVAAPAAFFVLEHQNLRKSLEYQAELTTGSINGIILSNPTMWRFEELRLSELLERKANDGVSQSWKLMDNKDEVIAASKHRVAPPTLSFSRVISDAGSVAGHLEVSRSLRPLLLSSAAIGSGSITFAIVLFYVFRFFPMRIINSAFSELEESENKYRSLYETMKEGMALHRVASGQDGTFSSLTVIDANASCAAMFDGDLSRIIGSDSFMLFGDTFREFLSELLKVMKHGDSISFELRLPGTEDYYKVHAFSPGPDLIATLFEDITERRISEQRIQKMAFHDALTGLPNRILLLDRLKHSIALAQRHNISMAVLFLDLDRFKQINDTLGHTTGDQLLVEVSKRLRKSIRSSDTLARFGGDEFVIIIPDLNKQLDITLVAQTLVDAINVPFDIMGKELRVTSSIGIALYPDDGDSSEELIKHADMAMYSSKELGRNVYKFYSPSMNQKAITRMETELGIRNALKNNEFFIEYQPILDAATYSVVAAEALVRWNHPSRGRVPPDQFITQAEENGLIIPLGEWVLRSVCRQMKAWADAGLPLMRFAVNVSSKQIENRDFPDFVKGVLQETGANPAQLEIEITESCLFTDTDTNIEAVFGMREWGISIAIDDFGTGYSSLAYIKNLPIDHIKIDRSFVEDLCSNPQDQAIVEAIISMSQKLGIENIAEGVETVEQLRFFQGQGCREVQGYYFHQPLSAEDFETLLRDVARVKITAEQAAPALSPARYFP